MKASPNYIIISTNEGEYKGIISSSSLFNTIHSEKKLIATLIKRNDTFIKLNDTLKTAVETMAKENIDVLPVISNENNDIIGVLSYRDIIATYKHGINEHEKTQPNLSLKRNGLKILLSGQKLVSIIKRKSK